MSAEDQPPDFLCEMSQNGTDFDRVRLKTPWASPISVLPDSQMARTSDPCFGRPPGYCRTPQMCWATLTSVI